MIVFRDAQSKALKSPKPVSWTKRMEEMLNRQRVRRQAQKNRRELLKLGKHLLNDLGFNSKGYPINWME
jgi:uncharacterized protein YjiS (DUF1127 family)